MTATDMPISEAKTPAADPPDTSVARILLSVVVLLAAWGASVATWGIPGLYLPALAMVPVIWVLLLIISRG
jgi:hypothetical protein